MAKRHHSGPLLVSQVRRCQELILARSGVDDFYELIKILLAKALDEKDGEARPLDYRRAQARLAAHQDILHRFIEGPPHFSAPMEVIDECFKVLASTRLSSVGYEALDAAFELMTAKQSKSDKGQYFTPRYVVDFCIDVLRPKKGELICDPACGSGAFLYSTYKFLEASVAAKQIFGFDISLRAVKTAALMSFLACKDKVVIEQVDSLELAGLSLLSGRQFSTIEDFMSGAVKEFRGFNVIATNPPFAGDVGATEYALAYEVANLGGQKVERDVLFLERCIRLLAPDGRLAIVVPDNKVSAGRFAAMRKWLMTRLELVSVVSLHPHTFRPYTSQKAAVIFGTKCTAPRTKRAISLYRSDRPGKSSSGDLVMVGDRIDHDLDEIGRDLARGWKC